MDRLLDTFDTIKRLFEGIKQLAKEGDLSKKHILTGKMFDMNYNIGVFDTLINFLEITENDSEMIDEYNDIYHEYSDMEEYFRLYL